ncbi:uncharacterized protein LOC112593726 [Melanaphis sacchari]|uniref:uncharacterized protein LOC112593726 n=1 Tax=Melanaphis sacchari TaxID=742174 RepID=UPI000DC13754|nr:uncharacterized protein LOC112593726 [Melanaphis sacchari]
MSKENLIDHLCNKQINLINEDELSESCKMSLSDISHSSENMNSSDKLNLPNIHGKNNFETSTMLINTDDNKLIGTNIVHDSNDLNQTECKFIINKINHDKTDLNSQEKNLLLEVIKKINGHISSTEVLDLDTQEFMELNLCKAVQRLHALSPTLNSDSTKTHTIKQIDIDNSTVISTLPLINELRNSDTKDKNSIIIDDLKKSEKFNQPSPKIDFEFPIQYQYVELQDKDQDAEIIAFRAMCEAMLKIGAIDNNIIDDNKTIVKKKNEINHKVNYFNSMEYEPSTSQLNSGVDDISKHKQKKHQINDLRCNLSDDSSPEYSNMDISKHLKRKKHQIDDLRCNLSDDSSSEYSNELSSKKFNSECYSDTDVIQSRNSKKIKLSDLTFEDEELDCMLIKNPLPKVQNVVINDLKCKNISDDSLEQSKLLLKENETIFYYSPVGKVHYDMLNYIKNKNCHSI